MNKIESVGQHGCMDELIELCPFDTKSGLPRKESDFSQIDRLVSCICCRLKTLPRLSLSAKVSTLQKRH